jgi:glycosyltransferase involved in cell wall biosynthesis
MNSVDIIVPCYNEAEGLSFFYNECRAVLDKTAGYMFHFIFIDDGSSDDTLRIIRTLAENETDVSYISFSRNFGKEAAMLAGLKHSTADLVVIMDADLQHPPAMIPSMLEGIEEGYDCCAARRLNREGERGLSSLFSSLFYRISNKLTDIKLPQNAVDYRMMTRQMVDAILQLSESDRFSKGIFAWVGFDTKWLPYENVERQLGTTKWSFRKLLSYAISGISSFSVAPLHFVTNMGFTISAAAFIYIIATLVKTFITGIDVPGYTTTLCALLLLGGIIELSLGILGEYISKIYTEAKDRPLYIIKQTNITGKDGRRRPVRTGRYVPDRGTDSHSAAAGDTDTDRRSAAAGSTDVDKRSAEAGSTDVDKRSAAAGSTGADKRSAAAGSTGADKRSAAAGSTDDNAKAPVNTSGATRPHRYPDSAGGRHID